MKDRVSILRLSGAFVVALALAAGCQSSSYTANLQLDSADDKSSLADRARSLRAELVEDQSRFAETVRAFDALMGSRVENADAYEDLQAGVDECAERASGLVERYEDLRLQGGEFFTGWDAELAQYNSPTMRGHSEEMLSEALTAHESLLAQLEDTTAQMDVVLLGMRDFLLFFNHSRSATGAAALEEEQANFDHEVEELNARIETTRQAAEDFLAVIGGVEPQPGAGQ